MTLHLDPRDTFVATCSCGRRFTSGAWQQLPRAGYLRPPGTPVKEFRLCPCSATPSAPLGSAPMLVGECLLLPSGERRWERSVKDESNHPRWGGRVCAASYFHAWRVTVIWESFHDEHPAELNIWAEHRDPDAALAYLLEDLTSLPGDFLAAFARPL